MTAVAVVVAVVAAILVLRTADEVAAESTEASTDGRAFETSTALAADDAADACSAESTDDSPRSRTGTIGAGHE